MGIIPQPSGVSPGNFWAKCSPITPSSVSPGFNVKEQYGGRDGLINSMFLSVTLENRSGRQNHFMFAELCS